MVNANTRSHPDRHLYVKKKGSGIKAKLAAPEAIANLHKKLFRNLQKCEADIRYKDDSESLHKYRISLRNIRVLLGDIRGIYPAEIVAAFKDEFDWLGDITSEVRDLDVYLLNKIAYEAVLPKGRKQGLQPFFNYVMELRSYRRGELIKAFNSKRYANLINNWRSTIKSLSDVDAPLANSKFMPIKEVASVTILRRFRNARRRAKSLENNMNIDQLHGLRIAGKKLRYLMEMFESLYVSRGAMPLVKRLRRFQDQVGDYLDLQVEIEFLQNFLNDHMTQYDAAGSSGVAMEILGNHLRKQQRKRQEKLMSVINWFASRKTKTKFRKLFKNTK